MKESLEEKSVVMQRATHLDSAACERSSLCAVGSDPRELVPDSVRTALAEITEPLTSIIVNAQVCLRLFADCWSGPSTIDLALHEIIWQAERAADLVCLAGNDNGCSQRRESSFLLMDAVGKARQSMRALTDANDVLVDVIDGARGARVRGDPMQIELALASVFRNAVEAMLESESPRRIVIRSTFGKGDASGTIRLSVRDTGPGVSEPMKQRIFEPFFSTRAGATGLGLTACRRIVERFGGAIEMEASATGGIVHLFFLVDASQGSD